MIYDAVVNHSCVAIEALSGRLSLDSTTTATAQSRQSELAHLFEDEVSSRNRKGMTSEEFALLTLEWSAIKKKFTASEIPSQYGDDGV